MTGAKWHVPIMINDLQKLSHRLQPAIDALQPENIASRLLA